MKVKAGENDRISFKIVGVTEQLSNITRAK